jgi:3'-5' exoribonuclease
MNNRDDDALEETMKGHYVAGLAEGVRVDEVFAVRSRDLRAARNGDAYLTIEFGDRTGTIPGVMFRPGPDEWSMPVGTVARVRGTVTTYRGSKRISVESLRPAAEYDRDDLMPSGARSSQELEGAFGSLVAGVHDRGLKGVLSEVFESEGVNARFAVAPGSKRRHHAYSGGLMEHTVSVASLCRVLALRYDGLDGDLLVTAALLHDIGKIDELRCDVSVDYTDAGRLLGHVVLGERIVSQAIERVGRAVDPGTAMKLLHLMISHHGEPQWGAPARPVLLEAVVLHHADYLDAQAAGFAQAVAGAGVMDESWSDSSNPFGRPLHVPTERVSPDHPPAVCMASR